MCWRYGVSGWLSAAVGLFACISAIFTQTPDTVSIGSDNSASLRRNHEETIKQLRVLGFAG
jgi:hypothetical protein